MSIPLNGVVLNGVEIEDTFAEAFEMKATRIIITAINATWAYNAAKMMTGFATSVIGSGIEAGIEKIISPEESPDGRAGIAVLLFSISGSVLSKQLSLRLGQCVLTCPTTAVYAGITTKGKKIPLGDNIRYFGDGYQISKVIDNKRYWRIPVMDGEFLCESHTIAVPAIGGGNFLILAESQAQALHACETAIQAMRTLPDIILPFPGGGVRSGSKVGSKYANLSASTHENYCPTLKGLVNSKLSDKTQAVMEVVIDGLTTQSIINAMRIGIRAVCQLGNQYGIHKIAAGNYGGKLGKYHFHLWEMCAKD